MFLQNSLTYDGSPVQRKPALPSLKKVSGSETSIMKTDFEPGSLPCHPGRGVEDPIYGRLLHMLRTKLESPVHIFDYDTRRSCVDNGRELRSFVEQLRKELSMNRFNFLTHSVGGIVFSCFLKELGGCYGAINRTVITSCPFLGLVTALTSLVEGRRGVSISTPDFGKDTRQPIHSYPAAYELLPVYPGAVSFDSSGEMFDVFNPALWHVDVAALPIFKEHLTKMQSLRDASEPAMLPLDRLPEELREKFLIVVGEGELTATHAGVYTVGPDNKSRNVFHIQRHGEGDGTVPLESSAIYKGNILTIAVRGRRPDRARHVFMLNERAVLSVTSIFLGQETHDPQWWSVLGSRVKKL